MSAADAAATAAFDQHFARVGAELDQLAVAYGSTSDLDPTRRRRELLRLLMNPSKGDGTALTHLEHVGTLANLLTVAVDRLEKRR